MHLEKPYKILLIEEIPSGVSQILNQLDRDSYDFHSAENMHDGFRKIALISPCVVIVSIETKNMKELGIIDWIMAEELRHAVVAVSTDASAEMVATTIRAGAMDFLHLPISIERMRTSIEQSIHRVSEARESYELNHPIFDESEHSFIGANESMFEVSKLIISAARSDASVFITGENGTGKEVCAELIHKYSSRHHNTMVPLNCAAIPKGLAESEVFGHVKGAFTGAHEDRIGVARAADNGTLFLDEIGEMSPDLQSKLLRFLQSGTFNRVGSSKLEKVDVRLICATNREPYQQIAEGSFREDLFYRLNVIQIHLPPLRERGDCITAFAINFLRRFAQEEGKRLNNLSVESITLLKAYSWPGNVRELQNIMRSIVVLHDGETVIPSMLPLAVLRGKGQRRRRSDDIRRADSVVSYSERSGAGQETRAVEKSKPYHIMPLDDVILATFKKAIQHCDGNVVRAAAQLKVSASTLYRKLKKDDSQQPDSAAS